MDSKKENNKSDVALREEAVLAFWQEHDIFNKSLEKDAPNGDFIFYDGPPFATGLPHYGHILASTIKDAIPRFWTMNGYRVPRKWGWDCHGLPLENLIEKRLGLATKRDIEEFGIKNFNESARSAVMEYADDWAKIIPRMGRWADMDNDYKTMDSNYTESVWWVFKQLHKKGLVYEGFKSMHLCPRCGTTLSNFEVNQGYKDIKDIAVTVKLPLIDKYGKVTDTSLLVWTTTPWTLPGNMAAAVNEDFEYVKVFVKTDDGDENVIIAKERLSQLGDTSYEILETFSGSKLVGTSYLPPFNYLSEALADKGIIIKNDTEGELTSDTIKKYAWKIFHADYVELGEEGTGAVHLAPAYGDDDMKLAQKNDVPIVHHVDASGRFMKHITAFAGQLVKPKDDDAGVSHLDADIEIVKALKERGLLFKKENITHSYPHCWRCDTPLLNYVTTSWFVEVTKIKDKLVEENSKIKWVPEHVGTNRFGKWLEGARDWAVSRQRYWGAPLPIWRNSQTQEYKIFGSLVEIQEYVPKSGNTYFLMRHGESQSNASNVVSTDIEDINPLTEKGKEQIAQAYEDLKKKGITKIIHSPFQRTVETTQLLAKELGLSGENVIPDIRIKEIQLGKLNGKSNDDYKKFIQAGSQWCSRAPEEGESWYDVKRRVGEFLYEINETYKDENILIVSHNSPLRLLGMVHDGRPLQDTDFDHDTEGKRYENAEVRELPFMPMPHNDDYALDFHRPYIDDFPLYDNGVKLERVPDVFDCWFESGSMPYGQNHYPFGNLDTFNAEKNIGFPAQFIAEGLDQTRGWFYSLIVLGTAVFGKSPFENVIVNGLIMAEDGKKLSKKLQNYSEPINLVNQVGADAVRFYLLSSPIVHGEDLDFSDKSVLELQRKNIGRLHNVLAMYEMYADGTKAGDNSSNVLDVWIVARLNQLITEVTSGYKNYELDKATRPVTDFIDDLSVWYLRRSRDRIKGEDVEGKKVALSTLRFVLQQLSLVIAPVMPFYSEYLWGKVKDETDVESVHLASWPKVSDINKESIESMKIVRGVVSLALEVRAKSNIKVRQPLSSLRIKTTEETEIDERLMSLIKDEVNVKEVVLDKSLDEDVVLDLEITPELKSEGDARDFMRAVQDIRKKDGLDAQDNIILIVQTSSDGEKMVSAFKTEIQNIVGASDITFANAEGTEVTIGGHSFTLQVKKL